MLTMLTRNWWLVVARGLLVLLFGLAAIVWPKMTLTALVLLFGVFAVAHGVLALLALFDPIRYGHRWVLALEGVMSISVGLIALIWPTITTLALLYVIAAWAILTGFFVLVAAIELRTFFGDLWLLGLSGGASLVFGITIAIWPSAGALAVLGIIAAYAIVYGVLLLVLGLHLHSLDQLFGGRGRIT